MKSYKNRIPPGYIEIPNTGYALFFMNESANVYNSQKKRLLKPYYVRKNICYMLRYGSYRLHQRADHLYKITFGKDITPDILKRLMFAEYEAQKSIMKERDCGAYAGWEDEEEYAEDYHVEDAPEITHCYYCGIKIENGICDECGTKTPYKAIDYTGNFEDGI